MAFFNKLERRIAAVFVGLLLLVMALMLLFVTRSGERIVRAEAERQLAAGMRNFNALVERERRQLQLAATVLSGDFSFREAIATQDRATVLSVLRNHGSRIGASSMMVLSLNGVILAETQRAAEPGRPFPFGELYEQASRNGQASGVVSMLDGRMYQLVIVPIMAPVRFAWVVMGFPLGDEWAADFARSSGLEVSLRAAGGKVHASSLGSERRAGLGGLASRPGTQWLNLADEHYAAVCIPLGNEVEVLLMHSVSYAEGVFKDLERALQIIAAVGIALFVVGGGLLARRMGGPVNALAHAAERIEQGDYALEIVPETRDEIGRLAASFDSMRRGIAAREQKISRLAYEDTLTGLPNRTRLAERVAAWPPGQQALIGVLDLDRFSAINDALGHPVGDALLQRVAERLAGEMPSGALFARLWGDEFAICVEGLSVEAAAGLAGHLLVALRTPFVLDGQPLDVGGSLGLAIAPQDGANLDELLRRAELAMYDAKRRQSGYSFAGDVGEGTPHEQLSLIGEMRRALDERQFVLHYQPKFSLREQKVVAVEALLRWQHPTRGLVPPGCFIPFAEQTGFIREITPWLLGEAVAQAAHWREAGIAVVVSVNLSARDLLNPALVDLLAELLETYALPPDGLCLEITESALMEDPTLALAHLEAFAALGLKLSIDDYGAGQASLAYLKRLPVHELKIDQSFIGSLSSSPKDAEIVRSTIALGHALGLTVVAEGVESQADLDWLSAAGCDIAQGYFISRPIRAAGFVAWQQAGGIPVGQGEASV